MTYDWTLYACLFLALWSAMVAGVFSAFSEFIMSALSKAEPASGIEAMQHINRDVIRTSFVAGILAIPFLSVALAIYAVTAYEGIGRAIFVLAAATYVVSVLGTTIFGNVPMNNRLDALDGKRVEARDYWSEYGRKWTRFNHVRALGSVLTAGLYLAAAITLVSSRQV
ncbi:DUF1772 domain-containing protein [Erythrobacter aquimaris]|uniref:DUF1772 domain-containing protein n=1 Tax=Qipengyuania aquimaris TaxID=255984 RepID=A0A6I4TFD3_9SPHN|nr:anthrone oxygenase family protein [Qipengyuania aquimaris]MXO94812.1 DUF1772 domain-containing protein [Qipengyuania aquimaris]